MSYPLAYSILLLLLLGISFPLRCQEQASFENMMESYFPMADEALNYEEIYEVLYQHYLSPIDLNSVDRIKLEQLALLSNEQINDFIQYRNSNGRLLSVFELQAIPSFDLLTIRKIKPFVCTINSNLNTDNRSLWTKIVEEKNSYLILRADRTIENKAGYISDESPAKYLGDPYRLYTKLRIQHTNDFSLGFTAEKDAGEQFLWRPSKKQYLYDFYSFHFQLKNKGRLQNLIIGDYKIQYGQSLVFGAGFSLGKGAHAIATARRSNTGLSPYGSVMEKNFFRGIANTIILHPQLKLTSFYSRQKLDALIVSGAVNTTDSIIQSTSETGLHHTALTLARKNNSLAQNTGLNLIYRSKQNQLNLGLNGLYTRYEQPILKSASKYNQFTFNGRQHFIGSVFANYYWSNMHLFSELAYSSNHSIGAVSGLILSISNSIQLSMVGRYYQRNFYSPMGSGFGEKTVNNNESGIYLGIRNALNKKTTLSAYVDKFQSPWLQYLVDGPSNGFDYLLRLNYDINRRSSFYLQFRQKVKYKNNKIDSLNSYQLAKSTKGNVIINTTFTAGERLSFRSRVQFSDYEIFNNKSRGIALIQDANYQYKNFKLSARYAIFDTEDFENRQYVYEKDVLYAFSIPAYQNIGSRAYLLVQYRVSKSMKVWAKWSQFRYFEQESVGSGNEKIDGDTKTDLKFQILFKL